MNLNLYNITHALNEFKTKNQFIINDIECTLQIHKMSNGYINLICNIYELVFLENINCWRCCSDVVKTLNIKNYISNTNILEIKVKNSEKSGRYIVNNFKVKYLDGDDVLEYNQFLYEHNKELKYNKKLYKNLDFEKTFLLKATSDIAKRCVFFNTNTHCISKFYKEWKFTDNEYFNYIITNFKNKKFILLRELEGDVKYLIYSKCKIIKFSHDYKIILFKILYSSHTIQIHNDLKIDPIHDWNITLRKIKINKIFNNK